MMRTIVAALSVAIMLAGCSGVHRVDPTGPPVYLSDFNRAVEGRRVEVALVGGRELEAENVFVRADSTSLVLLEPTRRDTSLSTSEILSVRVTGGGRAVAKGAGIGVLGAIGGGVMALVGFGAGSPFFWVAGLAIAVVSIPLGLMSGADDAVRGEVYIFAEGDRGEPS